MGGKGSKGSKLSRVLYSSSFTSAISCTSSTSFEFVLSFTFFSL
jgi:hypothetical protein